MKDYVFFRDKLEDSIVLKEENKMKGINKITIRLDQIEMINDYQNERIFNDFIFDDYAFVVRKTNGKMIYKIHKEEKINFVECRSIIGHEWIDTEFYFMETLEGLICGTSDDKLGMIFYESNGDSHKVRYENKIPDEDINKVMKECYTIWKIKQYIMNESYNRKVTIKEKAATDKTANDDLKDLKKKIKSHRAQYVCCLLDDIVNYTTVLGHKEIHCECWTVRGHFRHYKNGKVSFVRSYEKGQKRNTKAKIDNKEYTI